MKRVLLLRTLRYPLQVVLRTLVEMDSRKWPITVVVVGVLAVREVRLVVSEADLVAVESTGVSVVAVVVRATVVVVAAEAKADSEGRDVDVVAREVDEAALAVRARRPLKRETKESCCVEVLRCESVLGFTCAWIW
jgi:hypothetical protein